MIAVVYPAQDEEVLVSFGPGGPTRWPGEIVPAVAAGPLCTSGPAALTIWAPSAEWPRAFALLAMCKSVRPETSLVLTDELPPLDLVPEDGRIAVLRSGRQGPALAGTAAFSCRDLRNDRIFRWLLTGRVRRHPELEPLLRLHSLSWTAHGREVLRRWKAILDVLFSDGLDGMMPEELRADLKELAEVASRGERACTGGFHQLDPMVRGAAEWEEGARTYLLLAAETSAAASAATARWLAATSGWDRAPEHRQRELRLTAATALHRLVDDPWLGDEEAACLFAFLEDRRR